MSMMATETPTTSVVRMLLQRITHAVIEKVHINYVLSCGVRPGVLVPSYALI